MVRRATNLILPLLAAINLTACSSLLATPKGLGLVNSNESIRVPDLERVPGRRAIQSVSLPGKPPLDLPRLHFDLVPSFRRTVPGKVSIILRDSFGFKFDATKHMIEAEDKQAEALFRLILAKYGHKRTYSFSNGEPSETIEAEEKIVESVWGQDIPSLESMFVLTFDTTEDTSKISQELRRLPFVLTAYQTPKIGPAAIAPIVSQWTYSNLSGPISLDRDFTTHSEQEDWWWFNRHRVFNAWSAAGGVSTTVAVVDSGFDTDRVAPDSPIYSGFRMSFNENGGEAGTNVKEASDVSWSHGTAVSSVLGSPKNNDWGVAGIDPQVVIVPLKVVVGSVESVSTAIRYSYTSTPAWVTNVSIGGAGGTYL